jgi:hypothetical protein
MSEARAALEGVGDGEVAGAIEGVDAERASSVGTMRASSSSAYSSVVRRVTRCSAMPAP